mgnify:CR=1 FL=1
MSTFVIDTKDYEATYKKVLLTDPIGLQLRKVRTLLFSFSALLMVVSVYELKIDTLPGLGAKLPAEAAGILESILAIGTLYLLVQFLISALTAYLHWRIGSSEARFVQKQKSFHRLTEQLNSICQHRTILNEPITCSQKREIEELITWIEKQSVDLKAISRAGRALGPIVWTKLIAIELLPPLLVASVSLWLGGGAIWLFIRDLCQQL